MKKRLMKLINTYSGAMDDKFVALAVGVVILTMAIKLGGIE